MTETAHGYAIIEWVQSFHCAFLDYFFFGVTQLGNGAFYIVAIAFLYLCVDKRFAVKVFYLFIVGILANTIIKDCICAPRPDPEKVRIVMGYRSHGFSFPSGHSQGVLAFWGYCLTRFKSSGFVAAAVCLIVLIPVSRLYLGVHFPADVVGGLVIGAITIAVFVFFYRLIERVRWEDKQALALCFLIGGPLLFFLLHPTAEVGQFIGTMIGFGTGAFLERRFIGFEERAAVPVQIAKMAVCAASLALVMYLCARIPVMPNVRNLVLYAIGGFWVGYGIPYCIVALKKKRAAPEAC